MQNNIFSNSINKENNNKSHSFNYDKLNAEHKIDK